MSSASPMKQMASHKAEVTQSPGQFPNQTEESVKRDEDILKKFGVTFSYGDEEPGPPTNSDVMAAAAFGSTQQQKPVEGSPKENEVSEILELFFPFHEGIVSQCLA